MSHPFYLKLIEPQRNKIDTNGFKDVEISSLPGFDAHIGLQLEQLLLQNRNRVLKFKRRELTVSYAIPGALSGPFLGQ